MPPSPHWESCCELWVGESHRTGVNLGCGGKQVARGPGALGSGVCRGLLEGPQASSSLVPVLCAWVLLPIVVCSGLRLGM